MYYCVKLVSLLRKNCILLFLLSAFIAYGIVQVVQIAPTQSDRHRSIQIKYVQNKSNLSNPKQIKSCLNEVNHVHDIMVATMLTGDLSYEYSSMKLLKSIMKNVKYTKFDKIVLELAEKPIKLRKELENAGWKICTVKRITPQKRSFMITRYVDQFTKLILWNMTEYKGVVYIDSDAFVVGNIDVLLNVHVELDEKRLKIASTRGIRGYEWADTFNMGVFSIRPDNEEFNKLILLKNNNTVRYDYAMSEQGFLNAVYKRKWFDFGFEFNANIAASIIFKSYWKQHENNFSIIHFTMSKPWKCSYMYKSLCDKWKQFKI